MTLSDPCLINAAREALAPYSEIKVGVAVLSEKGQMFTGGNMQNASYGLTLCAERVAGLVLQ